MLHTAGRAAAGRVEAPPPANLEAKFCVPGATPAPVHAVGQSMLQPPGAGYLAVRAAAGQVVARQDEVPQRSGRGAAAWRRRKASRRRRAIADWAEALRRGQGPPPPGIIWTHNLDSYDLVQKDQCE